MNTSRLEFEAQLQQTLIEEFRSILRITAHWMAIPMFLIFWLADLLYAPDLKWSYLFIRLAIVPLCFVTLALAYKLNDFKSLQKLAFIYSVCLAGGINIMIFLHPDPGTRYYAGLNLIAFGSLSFIPFEMFFLGLTALGIYGPYFVNSLLKINNLADVKSVFINSFFIVSSLMICALIRHFNQVIRVKQVKAQLNLKQEILNRDEIIRIKTEEAVRLNALSSQFSPQIVETIKSGKLKLDNGGETAEICAIFIDIVNSTEKVTQLDHREFDHVISKFLDETIPILLAHDITIDKFLGDGILAFCNAPLERIDYVKQVAKAALKVQAKIDEQANVYAEYWGSPLKIRMGIAKGLVNVGFYGSQKYYRSYTAIGPVVNLASRLCSSALPGQIVIDSEVQYDLKNDFELLFLGRQKLKGFDTVEIFAYELKQALPQINNKAS